MHEGFTHFLLKLVKEWGRFVDDKRLTPVPFEEDTTI